MELVVAFVSALIGLSAAFFLSISFYDLLPEGWAQLRRPRYPAGLDGLSMQRYPLIPRTIKQTPLD
jgi:hypothetical protein